MSYSFSSFKTSLFPFVGGGSAFLYRTSLSRVLDTKRRRRGSTFSGKEISTDSF
jgi:hypothetical protein